MEGGDDLGSHRAGAQTLRCGGREKEGGTVAQNRHGETGTIPFSCTCYGLTVSALFFYARHTAGANSSEVWLCGAETK